MKYLTLIFALLVFTVSAQAETVDYRVSGDVNLSLIHI